ncbi:MAG: CRISPR-associated endoribonuclease Cas6 [Longicatena sp.]
MRIKIELSFDTLTLPIDTQSIIQGWVYHCLGEKMGTFYHDKGYQLEHRKFKMFTFSKLYGKYEIKDKSIVFSNAAKFYISSFDPYFIKSIYDTISLTSTVQLNKYTIKVSNIKVTNNVPFKDGIVTFSSMSALCVYKTDEKRFTHYYSPFDPEFEELLIENIKHKYEAYYGVPWTGRFHIVAFNLNKSGVYSFKDIKVKGHFLTLRIEADKNTFSILYETGLGMKNSSGFGMLEIVNK